MIQQFAVASASPRSIAWLIKPNEWDHFEEIIQYNCAMLGGYYNVLIPLTEQSTLSEVYQNFLVAYDPDLIVLAPDMTAIEPNTFLKSLSAFALVPWKDVEKIASKDPWDEKPDINAGLGQKVNSDNKEHHLYIAVADETKPDMSRFAFVACGDVAPRGIKWTYADKELTEFASGHRERFLAKMLKPSYPLFHAGMYKRPESMSFIPPPTRHKLADLISEEYQFPLSGAIDILKSCCQMQYEHTSHLSFINLTAQYKKRNYSPDRLKSYPAITILVSENFSLEDAVLFWNLRASGIYVVWLPFSEIEQNLQHVCGWLKERVLANGYYGGSFYAVETSSLLFAFSSPENGQERLQAIVDFLRPAMNDGFAVEMIPRAELVFYDYIRPSLSQEHVVVAREASSCTFIPQSPQEDINGTWSVSLKWNGLMLPQLPLLRDLVSPIVVEYFPIFDYEGRRPTSIKDPMPMKRFRIAQNRYIRVQTNTATPIQFNKPSSEEIIQTLFTSAGYSRVELNSTARYHRNFVDRAGSLETVSLYLSNSPYHELLELLSDNSDKQKKGWILKAPDQRRALHHLDLLEVLQKMPPPETRKYFDSISDVLPSEVIQLLDKQILERGFCLPCQSCSYRSWYPAELVGQTFKCPRCFHLQVCVSNPLWLYKLVEVIFQGFADNMQVPLLALNYLKQSSYFHFDWVPDSNVYWLENSTEHHKNLDILCLCDGELYVGEAKSNDEISTNQFAFYEEVSRRVALDGLVFATSQPNWNVGTLERINKLKTLFKGEIRVLTAQELYSNARYQSTHVL